MTVPGASAPDRYGVIGWPVAHSRSPQIHAMFAAQTRQHMVYEAIPVRPEALADALARFFGEGGLGLNVTVPHKETVIAHCDRVTARVEEAGAANTLWRNPKSGALHADNTDGVGLVRDLVHNLQVPLSGRRILLLGAGGAARGAVGPLLDAGCSELVVVNRTAARAGRLVDAFRAGRGGSARRGRLSGGGFELLDRSRGAERRFDVVINATAAGLAGETPAVAPAVAAGAFCYDMLYGEQTPFARWARAAGASGVALGFGMLVEQAAESFVRWRGVRPDTGPVLAALG